MTFLTRLHELSLSRPYVTVVSAWGLVVLAALGLPSLHLKTDGGALVPAKHPAVQEDRRIREAFGIKDPLVIVIPAAKGGSVFQANTLRLVQDWTVRLQALPSISATDVFSLATESSDRVLPGTLRFQPLLDPFPDNPTALEKLRDYLRAIRIFHGTLIAEDESATAIMVAVPQGVDRSAFVSTVRATLAESQPLPEGVAFIGAPVAEALLGTHLLQDLGLPGWLIGRQGGLSLSEAGKDEDRAATDGWAAWLARFGLVPLAMAVIGMVLLFSYASPLACLLAMAKVGACLVFVLGLMGLFGSPVYLPTAVMPVILTVAAITEEIHLLSCFARQLRQHPGTDFRAILRDMLPDVHVPMIKTAITTAVGFLSFAAAPIGPVRSFGLWTCVGILFGMSYALVVTPALFSLCAPRWLFPLQTRRTSAAANASEASAPFFAALGRFCVRRRYAVLIVAVCITAAAPLGIRRVIVQDSWIDGFAPDSGFARAANSFNEHFLGMHMLHVALEATKDPVTFNIPAAAIEGTGLRVPASALPENIDVLGWQLTLQCAAVPGSGEESDDANFPQPWSARIEKVVSQGTERIVHLNRATSASMWSGCADADQTLAVNIGYRPLLQPPILNALERLESFVAEKKDFAVGGVLGPATYLKTTNFIIWGKKEAGRVIPDEPERTAWLWQQYAGTRGDARLRQVVDAEYQRAIVTIYLKNANFLATSRLIAELRDYEQKHLLPIGISISFAGDVAVSQGMIAAVVSTPIRSIILSLVGILAVSTFVGRSLRVGLLCAMPSTFAVLIIFACMGWMAIPLGVATSMFAAMTLGIGDDFAIHLVEHFRRAVRAGKSTVEAAVEAVGAIGGTITIDAVALALGFAVLLVSQVPANSRLGLLLVLSLLICLLASLIVLPAMMVVVMSLKKHATQRS